VPNPTAGIFAPLESFLCGTVAGSTPPDKLRIGLFISALRIKVIDNYFQRRIRALLLSVNVDIFLGEKKLSIKLKTR
jgi:hypothetical protein